MRYLFPACHACGLRRFRWSMVKARRKLYHEVLCVPAVYRLVFPNQYALR